MADLTATIDSGFAAYYETIRNRIHTLVDPLTDE